MNYHSFTSESVCEGHPDKICDQISDAVLDEALRADPKSRVAVETLVTKNHCVLAGEVTCSKKLSYEKIARSVIRDLGYTRKAFDFHWKDSPVDIYIHQQAPDISQGVDTGGAGDQGMMFGYACDETPELMPLPITIAHALAQAVDKARKSKRIPYLRPDGKSQVVVDYQNSRQNGKPRGVSQVILAVPHEPRVATTTIRNDLFKKVVLPTLKKFGYRIGITSFILNGTGRWEIGGPASDSGVTGRKIMVDTYGSMGRHGGGAFSGKDPTKVDRSAAYACRFLAKNIVAHKLARRCEVKVAYVIGQAEPIAKSVETFGTQRKSKTVIKNFMDKILNLSVPSILKTLDLRRPIYRETARYGHFGRDSFPWEQIVKA